MLSCASDIVGCTSMRVLGVRIRTYAAWACSVSGVHGVNGAMVEDVQDVVFSDGPPKPTDRGSLRWFR